MSSDFYVEGNSIFVIMLPSKFSLFSMISYLIGYVNCGFYVFFVIKLRLSDRGFSLEDQLGQFADNTFAAVFRQYRTCLDQNSLRCICGRKR